MEAAEENALKRKKPSRLFGCSPLIEITSEWCFELSCDVLTNELAMDMHCGAMWQKLIYLRHFHCFN